MNDPPNADRGSLLQGFILGWVVLIGSYMLVAILLGVLGSLGNQAFGPLMGLVTLLPLGAIIALIVWFASHGKPRSAAGVGLTIASLIGLVLLLVAACFGLLATSNFH